MSALAESHEPERPAASSTPRRLTQAAILEQLIATLNRGGQDHSSVRLTRNARGDTQIEVVVRTGDSPEIHTAADAAARARQIYDHLASLYPMAEPDAGKSRGDAS